MVVEREPPRVAPSPAKANQPAQHVSGPEFGKATSLQSPLRSSIFNVPKPQKVRPEHHRPTSTAQPPREPQARAPQQGFIDPFRPRQPVQHQPVHAPSIDQDVIEISKPPNPPAWTSSYSSRPATYSSFSVPAVGMSSVNKPYLGRLGNLVDLTDTALFEDKFGAPDPYDYVDAKKADENIKALLAGVFEDEEDKPKTRGRKKRLDETTAGVLNKLNGLKVNTGGDEKDGTQRDEDEEEEEEDDGTVEGLMVKLLPHQVNGVAWMKDKEAGKKKNGVVPKGGILADDMGLGKTIQSIALLLTNPRPPLSDSTKSDKHKLSNLVGKGTLVVAPLALIKQWEAEIANRVESSHKMRVCVHHGPQRTKRFEDLRKYDVVVTTYQVLVSEHGNSSTTADGPQVGCFGLHWYRVILDEAHTIKNRRAKATIACYALRAEFRWCLTGTPMQNNLDELQSLIQFLRIKPYNEMAAWKEHITLPMKNGRGGLAMKRLQVFLKAFMKRRTKDILKAEGALNPGGKADLEGKPSNGFKITERRIERIVATFSAKERSFYESLEQRADKSLKKMMGGEKLSYASALVLLLRLCQACNHPELVGGSMANDKEALTTGQGVGPQTPRKSKAVDNELDDVADLLGGLSVQTKKCDVCQLELTKEERSKGSIRCDECNGDLAAQREGNGKKKTHKGERRSIKVKVDAEIFKPRLLKNRRIVFDSDDEDEENGEWVVPKSQQHVTKLGKAGGSDDENVEGGGEWLGFENSQTGDESSIQGLGSHKKKVIQIDTTDDETEESSHVSEEETDDSSSDEDSLASLITSTKIQHLLKILHRESSTNKFIVFSRFTSMLDLIEPFLKRDRLVFTRYDGKMRNDHREASLERLRNEDKTRILLCSLKCGSLGLNLTAASRVVILEPFWNPFVEEQAIDRVHRLNQTVDVIVYKITVEKTVEERILELQEKKRLLAEAAIEGGAVAKLTLQDMLNLFKHDAVHDDRHEDTKHLGETRILPPLNGSGDVGRGNASRRVTPPVMERDKGKVRREDAVFGRKW